MHSYRFSFGNSSTDGIGLSFTVRATTEDAAVATAKQAIEQFAGGVQGRNDTGLDIIDIDVYVGPTMPVSSADIDDCEFPDDDSSEA